MSDSQFICPHCNQSLEAPEEMFGTAITCPTCNNLIQLPVPEPPPLLHKKLAFKKRPPSPPQQKASMPRDQVEPPWKGTMPLIDKVEKPKMRWDWIIISALSLWSCSIICFYYNRNSPSLDKVNIIIIFLFLILSVCVVMAVNAIMRSGAKWALQLTKLIKVIFLCVVTVFIFSKILINIVFILINVHKNDKTATLSPTAANQTPQNPHKSSAFSFFGLSSDDKEKEQYKSNLVSTTEMILKASDKCINMCGIWSEWWTNGINDTSVPNIPVWLRIQKKCFEGDGSMNDIADAKSKIDERLKILANPPPSFQKAHEVFADLFGTYCQLYSYAASPSGSLVSYNNSVNELHSKLIKTSNELKALIP